MTRDARSAQPASGGLMVSLRRLGSTLVTMLQTRAELLAREFERERLLAMRLVLLGIGVLFFAALGALTFTLFVIVLFWDSQRLVVIGFLTVVYLGIAGGLAIYVRRQASRVTRPFAATVAELKKDCEHFVSHR